MKKTFLIIMLILTINIFIHAQTNSEAIIAQGNNLSDKLAWLNAFAQSYGTYLIAINQDETIRATTLEFTDKSNITIIIVGIDDTRSISTQFTVGNGVWLIIDNQIRIIPERYYSSAQPPIVVNQGGNLIMNSGSTVAGDSFSGNAIRVRGSFVMNGGSIYQSVSIERDGWFHLNDGNIISSHDAVGVGGVFEMNGGTISGSRGSSRTMVNVAENGQFIMNGGNIMEGGIGVSVFGHFNMIDGTISNNSNVGVLLRERGSFIMNGGTITANRRSGVNLENRSSFVLVGGSIISNPSIGVFIGSSGARFTMQGGIITGNTSWEQGGGGVFVNGYFEKTGGVITGYSSDNANGNVVRDQQRNVLNFRGHAVYAKTNSGRIKIKDTTAGENDNLFYDASSSSGAWDN